MCSHFIVGNKIFCSLKNESLLSWTKVHFKGGGEGGVKFCKKIFWGGEGYVKSCEVNISGWGYTLEDTIFHKHIFSNISKINFENKKITNNLIPKTKQDLKDFNKFI